MKPKSKLLFWEILNCQRKTVQGNGCPGCDTIIKCQSQEDRIQVAEPWSGDIDNASVLFIGQNPALCSNELFPSRQKGNPVLWDNHCKKKGAWTEQDVENYFEGRFGIATCSECNKSYFVANNQTVLTNICSCRNIQNPYWSVYNKYFQILRPDAKEYSFAVTDIVHCKGAKMKGFIEASVRCRLHTLRVVNLFLNNGASSHAILFFGVESESYMRMIWPEINFDSATTIGSYNYVRNNQRKVKEIKKTVRKNGSDNYDIYYCLPSPSRNNCAARDIVFNNQQV